MSTAQRLEYPPLRIFLKTIAARAYPRVVAANRQKTWLFFDMAFPVVGALAMVLGLALFAVGIEDAVSRRFPFQVTQWVDEPVISIAL